MYLIWQIKYEVSQYSHAKTGVLEETVELYLLEGKQPLGFLFYNATGMSHQNQSRGQKMQMYFLLFLYLSRLHNCPVRSNCLRFLGAVCLQGSITGFISFVSCMSSMAAESSGRNLKAFISLHSSSYSCKSRLDELCSACWSADSSHASAGGFLSSVLCVFDSCMFNPDEPCSSLDYENCHFEFPTIGKYYVHVYVWC